MSNNIIDMHVHFAAPYDKDGGKEGCYWDERFTRTVAFFALRIITGMPFADMGYENVKKRLFKEIHKAKRVDKVVLLALDKVYESQGEPLEDKTMLYMSNQCLAELKEDYKNQFNEDKILLGCSVHPFNPNWEAELDKCISEYGAVLCKWMPSTQHIDPQTFRFDAFYKKLADHNLPLLYHTGPEHSIPTTEPKYSEFDNPKYIVDALNAGVTVIAAHCALPFIGLFEGRTPFDQLLDLFKKREEKGWKLYADLSAFCTSFRNEYIKELKGKIKSEYLIYGSDFPIPTSGLTFTEGPSFFDKLKVFFKCMSMSNLINKSHYLVGEMGFDECIFTNFPDLCKKIVR